MMDQQERRQHVRIHFERSVQVEFFTEVFNDCQVRNVSLGGMFVIGQFSRDLDDKCYVNLVQRGNNTYLTLQALAKIVRQDDNGIGLQFTAMSFESLMSLEMILLFQEREKSPDAEIKIPDVLPFEISEEISSISGKYNPFIDSDK